MHMLLGGEGEVEVGVPSATRYSRGQERKSKRKKGKKMGRVYCHFTLTQKGFTPKGENHFRITQHDHPARPAQWHSPSSPNSRPKFIQPLVAHPDYTP